MKSFSVSLANSRKNANPQENRCGQNEWKRVTGISRPLTLINKQRLRGISNEQVRRA